MFASSRGQLFVHVSAVLSHMHAGSLLHAVADVYRNTHFGLHTLLDVHSQDKSAVQLALSRSNLHIFEQRLDVLSHLHID